MAQGFADVPSTRTRNKSQDSISFCKRESPFVFRAIKRPRTRSAACAAGMTLASAPTNEILSRMRKFSFEV